MSRDVRFPEGPIVCPPCRFTAWEQKAKKKRAQPLLPCDSSFPLFLCSHTVGTKWLLSLSLSLSLSLALSLSLSLYRDSLFLQTNGELIQILRTLRHSSRRALEPSRLPAGPMSPERGGRCSGSSLFSRRRCETFSGPCFSFCFLTSSGEIRAETPPPSNGATAATPCSPGRAPFPAPPVKLHPCDWSTLPSLM